MRTRSIPVYVLLLLWNITEAQVADSMKYRSVAPDEFRRACYSCEKSLLIDVREFFEYKKSRIENAINIPSSGNIESAADTLNKELILFLYCTTGFRSKKAAKLLYDKGFRRPYSLAGGIKAWKKEGLPVNRKKIILRRNN